MPDRDFHPVRSAELCLAHLSIAVGRPVARPPPHRSRRADFPHRALQGDSLCTRRHQPQSMRPSSLVPTGRLASWPSSTWLDEVSFVGSVTLPAPSPCTRLSRARSTMSRSDSPPAFGAPPSSVGRASPVGRLQASVCLCVRVSPCVFQITACHTCCLREPMGPPKFSDASLHACQALQPRQTLGNLAVIGP